MPLSLVVRDRNPDVPEGTYEALANGDSGAAARAGARAREPAVVHQHNAIKNVVWMTADVHYAQATHYGPSQAAFRTSAVLGVRGGPLNAGTFGPNELDPTFGPEIRFPSVTAGMKQNLPPTDGKQYFGAVRIEAPPRR